MISALGTAALSVALYYFMGQIIEMFTTTGINLAQTMMQQTFKFFFGADERGVTSSFFSKGIDVLFPLDKFSISSCIVTVAYAVLGLCLIIGVLNSMMAPMRGDQAESPLTVVFYTFLGGALIYLFFGDGTNLLTTIGNTLSNMLADSHMEHVYTLSSDFDWKELLNGFKPVDYVMSMIVSCSILVAVIKAVVAYMERLFSFILYAAMGPICFAMLPVRELRNSSKEWVLGILGQTLGIVFASLMWMAFLDRYVKTFNEGLNLSGQIWDYAVCIVLLSICENVEQIMNAIGLRTLPSGDSAISFLGGTGAFRAISKMTGSLAKGTANTVKDLGKGLQNLGRDSSLGVKAADAMGLSHPKLRGFAHAVKNDAGRAVGLDMEGSNKKLENKMAEAEEKKKSINSDNPAGGPAGADDGKNPNPIVDADRNKTLSATSPDGGGPGGEAGGPGGPDVGSEQPERIPGQTDGDMQNEQINSGTENGSNTAGEADSAGGAASAKAMQQRLNGGDVEAPNASGTGSQAPAFNQPSADKAAQIADGGIKKAPAVNGAAAAGIAGTAGNSSNRTGSGVTSAEMQKELNGASGGAANAAQAYANGGFVPGTTGNTGSTPMRADADTAGTANTTGTSSSRTGSGTTSADMQRTIASQASASRAAVSMGGGTASSSTASLNPAQSIDTGIQLQNSRNAAGTASTASGSSAFAGTMMSHFANSAGGAGASGSRQINGFYGAVDSPSTTFTQSSDGAVQMSFGADAQKVSAAKVQDINLAGGINSYSSGQPMFRTYDLNDSSTLNALGTTREGVASGNTTPAYDMAQASNNIAESLNDKGYADGYSAAQVAGFNHPENFSGKAIAICGENGGAGYLIRDNSGEVYAVTNGKFAQGEALLKAGGTGTEIHDDTGYTYNGNSDSLIGSASATHSDKCQITNELMTYSSSTSRASALGGEENVSRLDNAAESAYMERASRRLNTVQNAPAETPAPDGAGTGSDANSAPAGSSGGGSAPSSNSNPRQSNTNTGSNQNGSSPSPRRHRRKIGRK